MMRKTIPALLVLGLAALLQPACGSDASKIGQGKKLVVTITSGTVGSAVAPNKVTVGNSTAFTVHVEAHKPDGTVDRTFNGSVALSVEPGTVTDLSVRSQRLTNGVVDGVVVPVSGAFGQAHIWATDLGYEPSSPDANPPPQCSDGIDNNNNGLIDYPADPGCYAPVDNTEDLGSYASGASETIFFELPRIDLVRGYNPPDGNGNATAFPHQQLSIDTGWRGGQNYAFNTVVIGLTAAGFYVQDMQTDMSPAHGYAGLYAYNFSTPAFMRVCDRVQILSGTASDFYGYTELNYPTWQLEFWNPMVRDCLVPEPTVLATTDLNNPNVLWKNEATLVRVQSAGTVSVHVAKHFGKEFVKRDDNACITPAGSTTPQAPPCYVPDVGHSNCDFNRNGKVDFTDTYEAACATACSGSCTQQPLDYECSEYSQFASQNDFEFIVEDSSNNTRSRIQASAAAANGFNPLAYTQTSTDPNAPAPPNVRSFTGLLAYFSGGCQFTMNARCDDDIVADMNGQPSPSNVACVHPRSQSDINANSQ